MTPRQVWRKYGFPLVGKEMSNYIHAVRFNPNSKVAQLRLSKDTQFGISRKWRYLISEPYDVHNICCDKLKKEPMHRYNKESGRYPIIGVIGERKQA